MLGTILAFILLVGIAGSLVVMYKSRNKRDKKIAPLVTLAVCVALLLTVPFSIHTIEPGQVGVVKVWARQKR